MRKFQNVLMVLAMLCFAIPAFAEAAQPPSVTWLPIGIGIGIALSAGLCGIGQGKAIASATESVARNPGATASIQLLLILGLAFIESLTLFTFATIFFKIK